MTSDVQPVRVTSRLRGLSKNHTFLVVGMIVLLLALGIALRLAVASPSLYPVKINGKYGYMNKSGKLVIQPQFDRADLFAEGAAAVELGRRWGFIDKSGKLIVPPQYDLADPYSEGLALVGVGPQLGYIDKSGKFAINPQFRGRGTVRSR